MFLPLKSYTTFKTFEIIHVWPDPQAVTSPVITQAPDVSTLRIIAPYNFAEWKIIQQSRDRSVLKGFATIGGLWTFLGGIFTALFGTSILRIIFGMQSFLIRWRRFEYPLYPDRHETHLCLWIDSFFRW